MKKIKHPFRFDSLPTTYTGLVRLFMPRTIHDKVDLENATEIIDAMAGYKLNEEQADYLDTISTLVAAYEQKHYPLPKTSPVEALEALMEYNHMTPSELHSILNCDRSLVYKLLRGERALTRDHIKTLCHRFKVSADCFI